MAKGARRRGGALPRAGRAAGATAWAPGGSGRLSPEGTQAKSPQRPTGAPAAPRQHKKVSTHKPSTRDPAAVNSTAFPLYLVHATRYTPKGLPTPSAASFFQSRLVLSYTRHWLGERSPLGRAAALLAGYPPPTTHYLNNGPAVRCRSSPEFPFRFIWVLGWSTWYLWPIKS
jgi:hypothetical protein